MNKPSDKRIYVGNLPPDVRTKDVEDLFYKYGKIRYIDLKNRKGPPFAFIEYEDSRDAEDAIDARDRYNFDGYKLRVEFQKGPRDGSSAGFRRGPGGGPPTRRSGNRCTITGLPPTGSWQDVKDHMREAGNVCYADVFKDGTGVVEFTRYEDMKYAVKNLDDTKFRSHEGETSYIRVKIDTSSRDSYSPSRSRSRSRSKLRGRDNGRERATPSYSPARRSRSYYSDDSRSRSRSRDKRRKSSRSKSPRNYHRRTDSRSMSRSRSRSPRDYGRKRNYSRSRSPLSRSRSINRDSRSKSNDRVKKSISPERRTSKSPSSQSK